MEYFDEFNNLRPELLDIDASNEAKTFVFYYKDRQGNSVIDKKRSLSSAQLRRFYNEFKSLQKKASKADKFEEVLPLIKMVKSKASYSANRSQNKIPESFRSFLEKNINKIDNKKTFNIFMLHFEAVVGFFYGIKGIRND